MKSAALFPVFVLSLFSLGLGSCTSDPTLSVSSSLAKHGLRGRTLAVGGLTAPATNIYPGQAEESSILLNAEEELRKHLKHSRVLSMAAVQQAVGAPPSKFSSGVPIIILGSKLSPGFMKKAQAKGIDYLLWVDLRGNSVDHDSRQIDFVRVMAASYSLLDTATGHVVWQVESLRSGRRVQFVNLHAGLPRLPAVLLPPAESQIMRGMTQAALKKLPD